jgi:hypothetical protein
MRNYADALARLAGFVTNDSTNVRRQLRDLVAASSARAFSRSWERAPSATELVPERPFNALRQFFENRAEGPGIWKWEHYFDIYHRHFSRFIGRPVRILEVGIYSGGSLDMWQSYFGPDCEIYGVDIEQACMTYERRNVRVFIGDQADRQFWKTVKSKIPPIDILVDDGGHLPQQQIITLEEMLPHIRPGGVFLCEDVQGNENAFASYVSGLMAELNTSLVRPGIPIVAQATPFQESIGSFSIYPFVVVIERNERPVSCFVAPKHGTQWQPFL